MGYSGTPAPRINNYFRQSTVNFVLKLIWVFFYSQMAHIGILNFFRNKKHKQTNKQCFRNFLIRWVGGTQVPLHYRRKTRPGSKNASLTSRGTCGTPTQRLGLSTLVLFCTRFINIIFPTVKPGVPVCPLFNKSHNSEHRTAKVKTSMQDYNSTETIFLWPIILHHLSD